MSRTVKGSKSIGSEPWNRRPFNKGGGVWGKFHKKRTSKAERQQRRKVVQDSDEYKH